jgi:hypothetical protein
MALTLIDCMQLRVELQNTFTLLFNYCVVMPWGIGPYGGNDALGHRDFYGGSDALGIWETFGGKDALGACGTNQLGT